MAAVQSRSLGALGRMGVVAAMHVAVALVLANAFGILPKVKPPDEVTGTVINEQPPADPVPVIDPPANVTPDIYIPEPVAPPIDQVDEHPEIIGPAITDPQIRTGPIVPPPIPETAVRVDPRHPLTQPLYPAQKQREGVEGAVDVEVFVQPDGRVGDARIAKSSGYEDFDRVTLDEARRHWRLMPATRDGQAVAQWYRMRVSFRLKNQP